MIKLRDILRKEEDQVYDQQKLHPPSQSGKVAQDDLAFQDTNLNH